MKPTFSEIKLANSGKTPEFKALRAEAREVIAAYADGADFDYVISRLAPIGEKMAILLA